MKTHLLAIILGLEATSATGQFFNAPALAMVMTVGQKKSCAKAFPELAEPLQIAYQEMARRNSDVLPLEAFAQMDAKDDLSKSPVFAKVSRAGCEALIQQMPEMSLR